MSLKLISTKVYQEEFIIDNNQIIVNNKRIECDKLKVTKIEQLIRSTIDENILIPYITHRGFWKLYLEDKIIEGSLSGLYFHDQNITDSINDILESDYLLFGK